MQPRLSAELPETCVGLVEARIDLIDEPLDHLGSSAGWDLAGEARVEEEPADREHHLAVDVVLHVLERLVADPNRPVSVEPGEVLELALRSVRVAVDPVRGLEHPSTLLADVAEVLEEELHLLGVSEPLERVQREVRVAQPAEAVVPRSTRAGMLGKARRRSGEQRAGVLVLVELERERRAHDLALVVAGNPRPFHPAAPVVDRPLEESLRGVLEPGFERLAPREDEMAVLLEQERALVLDVRERDIRGQPDRRREARVLDVVRTPPEARLDEAVLVDRPAVNPGTRLSGERAQDPHEHLRLEVAVVELEARCEVDELELASGAAEDGTQDVRVLDVLLAHLGRVDALDAEHTAALAIEERPEDEARVRARPAHPLHGSLAE